MKPSYSMTEETDLKKKRKVLKSSLPFRIEIFDDSNTPLSERLSLVKGTIKQLSDTGSLPSNIGELCGLVTNISGVTVFPPSNVDLNKSNLSVQEFADVMGTTATAVRRIANRLGNKVEFAKFIKSKLPDIRISHGLDKESVTSLYSQALGVLKGLSAEDWSLWKSTLDFSGGVSDTMLAEMIRENGLLNSTMVKGAIIQPATPPQLLASPEPIQEEPSVQINPLNFVGGNLALSSII